jgi:phage terminase small subunit
MANSTPKGLGNAGRALWRQIAGGMAEGWELDERELALLTLACRQRDDLSRLETVIGKEGVMATGSTGQPVVHPAVLEARQARLAINRLLGALELPDADETPRSDAGRHGQRAARARHGRDLDHRERDQIRGLANG